MLKKQLKLVQLIIGATATSILIASCSYVDKHESTGQYIDSSVITTKVKADLLADDSIKSLPITVKTYKHTVQLSGFVDNRYQKQRAVEVAKRVAGVQDVEDSLVIKSH
jgi:osmotically-inducible protein OsmY